MAPNSPPVELLPTDSSDATVAIVAIFALFLVALFGRKDRGMPRPRR